MDYTTFLLLISPAVVTSMRSEVGEEEVGALFYGFFPVGSSSVGPPPKATLLSVWLLSLASTSRGEERVPHCC